MDEAFEQFGIFMDQYQVFVLPTHLEDDQWIEGIQFVPGNKKIVRHASISVEPSDQFDDYLTAGILRPGYYSFGGLGKIPDQPFWYTWSPQQEAIILSARLCKISSPWKQADIAYSLWTDRPYTIRFFFRQIMVCKQ